MIPETISEYLATVEGRNALYKAMTPAADKCFRYLILKYEMEAQAGLVGNLNLCIGPEKE